MRQLIIKLYSRLFRYQIWNLQSGQPLLHEVFNQNAQLNSFAYFCHVANTFDDWGRLAQCSGVGKALSVCNVAVVTALGRLLNSISYQIDFFPTSRFYEELFCASLKSDFLEHFPRRFLDLSAK